METADGTAAAPVEAAPEAQEPVEATEAPPAEAPAPEEAAPVEEAPDFDAIAAVFDTENPSDTFIALDGVLEQEGRKSFKVSQDDYREALKNPAVAQLLHNARNMGLRTSDEAARASRALTERQRALDEVAAKNEEERVRMWSLFQDPRLREQVKPPEGEKPDMYTDPAGFAEWVADQRFAKRMGEFMEQVGAISDEAKQQVAATLAEKQRAEQRSALETFTQENPDFFDYGDRIEELVKQHNIPAQKAYLFAKAEAGTLAPPAQAGQKPDPRRAMRPTSRVNGQKPLPDTPDLTGMELQDWYEANPGTRERDYVRWKKHGMSM